MGDISVNKLGGLSLIVGPVVALVFYFIQQFGVIGSDVDPADGNAVVMALTGNSSLATITAIGITVGLIILLHGIVRLAMESSDALSSLGMKFVIVGTVGWVVASALTAAIAGDINNGGLYGGSLGINQFSSIVWSLGFLLVVLGISGRDYINKNVAYVVGLVALVSLVVSVIGGFDSSTLQTMNLIGGICYIVFTLWSIWLGKDMLARD
tara:strand:+ start:48 stop:677 length:630 start_codon:yes stop_codon:yes gene_type:complete